MCTALLLAALAFPAPKGKAAPVPKVEPVAVEPTLDSPEAALRSKALEAVEPAPTPEVSAQVRAMVTDDLDPAVRQQAARKVAGFADPTGLSVLRGCALKDMVADVRRTCAASLVVLTPQEEPEEPEAMIEARDRAAERAEEAAENEHEPRRNALLLSHASALFDLDLDVGLGYERLYGERKSILVEAVVHHHVEEIPGFKSTKNDVSVSVEPHFYLGASPVSFKGWFIAPFIRYRHGSAEVSEEKGSGPPIAKISGSIYSLGATGGYSWAGDRFVARLGIGLGVEVSEFRFSEASGLSKEEREALAVGGVDWIPAGDLRLGVAF